MFSELEIFSIKDKKWKQAKVTDVDITQKLLQLEIIDTSGTVRTWIEDKSQYLRKTMSKKIGKEIMWSSK